MPAQILIFAAQIGTNVALKDDTIFSYVLKSWVAHFTQNVKNPYIQKSKMAAIKILSAQIQAFIALKCGQVSDGFVQLKLGCW